MLIGEFETKLTDKNRLAIPKKFRDALGEKIIVTAGYEGCLILVNEEMFMNLTKEITEGKFINDAVRDTTRFLIGSAHEIDADSQGRFVLPPTLKSYAKLNTEATFLGLMRWVEIWDKDLWAKRRNDVLEKSSEIGEKLEKSLSNNG